MFVVFSGDYALAKEGKMSEANLGTTVPSPANIPHSSPSVAPLALSGTSPTNNITPISLGSSGDALANAGANLDHVALPFSAESRIKDSKR